MNSVQICNLSLMMIGMPIIVSFDDENTNARMCKNFFPVIRDRVLRDHSWSFALSYEDMNTTTETSPEPDFPFVCAKPFDLIRILEVDDGEEYRLVGNRVLTKRSGARIKYVRRVEDPEQFDELFIEALQYALAAEIVITNTRDVQLANFYRNEYERRLIVARSIDSAENRHDMKPRPRRSHWIEARGGGGKPCRHGNTVWTEGTEGKQIVEG